MDGVPYTHVCHYCGNQTRVIPRRLGPGTTAEVVEIPVPQCTCHPKLFEMARIVRADG